MKQSAIVSVERLGFPWQTLDPFLFCVHHDDAYPAGNESMGPNASLAGRNIGMDFEGVDGWRMYHGEQVPGFPRHPHRGFETVTLARRGFIDHSDSLGATARFGHGDAQWMTAGSGIVHAEMFPLVRRDAPNPTELFQIWLNLPARDKMVDPYFTMLWGESIPIHEARDASGAATRVAIVAGAIDGLSGPRPPPNSWAARPEAELAIWTIRLDPRAEWTLPKASPSLNRVLYFFAGARLEIADRVLEPGVAIQLTPNQDVPLKNGHEPSELLMLQGMPIGDPVVHYGPFVMNSPRQIEEAIIDYRRTQYGGWPWSSEGPVHPRDAGRFAVHADGKREVPTEIPTPSNTRTALGKPTERSA